MIGITAMKCIYVSNSLQMRRDCKRVCPNTRGVKHYMPLSLAPLTTNYNVMSQWYQ